jgi:hypothetical protein
MVSLSVVARRQRRETASIDMLRKVQYVSKSPSRGKGMLILYLLYGVHPVEKSYSFRRSKFADVQGEPLGTVRTPAPVVAERETDGRKRKGIARDRPHSRLIPNGNEVEIT